MKVMTVMVVDDSFIMHRKIEKIMGNIGGKVIAYAKSGAEALDQYAVHRPDVVTMDITMPDMDGIEATKNILKLNPKAVIIMVTSHGQELMVLDAVLAGAKGYVQKPIEEGKTDKAIMEALMACGVC